ncbi:MAG: ribonuclease Y [candidate division Zixibacteria bacterium]|nr:ribonuclease Y [candidate division Zixibacteria bacterium]
MEYLSFVLVAVVGLVLGFGLAWVISRRIGDKSLVKIESQAERIIREAKKDAAIRKKEATLEIREKSLKERADLNREVMEKRGEIDAIEKEVVESAASLQKKIDVIESKEKELIGRVSTMQTREKGIELAEDKLQKTLTAQNEKLQKIAQMTPEEAKQQLVDNMTNEAKLEAAAHIKEIREQAEADAEKEAREVILQSIYRCAADHTVETTVSVVTLPGDEMKGRIIGREGRNIRAFETATGIDVIVDDTPEAVILSGYDPVRREIARMALEKLITDGRIHPTRIEEVVEKSEAEMEVIVREFGEQACFELGVHGAHTDLVKMLGKLNYRTSYGQNVLAHSKEVAILCGLMASQLGLDDLMAKRCGLMHDIGKAIDRVTEGTHTQIGADFLTRYKEHEFVVNSAESHHGDVEMISPYPVLVQTADAISGARPGARREPLEAYVKRLTQLEELAGSFKGVSKAYAIQAGREIRVVVEHDKVNDLASTILAGDIAARIESEMQYPGQIKVTVIRELRTTEYAK